MRHCARAGILLDAALCPDREGRSTVACYVEYDSPESASKAVRSLHRTNLGGKEITVRPAKDKGGAPRPRSSTVQEKPVEQIPSRRGSEPRRRSPPPPARVYVVPIPREVSRSDLADFAAQETGYSVTRCDVTRTPDGADYQGILDLDHPDGDSDKMARRLDGKRLEGVTLTVSSQPPTARPPPRERSRSRDRRDYQRDRSPPRRTSDRDRGPPPRGGGGPQGGAFRSGDWICSSCGNHNFAYRQVCKMCGEARSK